MRADELKFWISQLEKAKRIQSSEDLFTFCQIYFNNQYPPSKYHKEICRHLQDFRIKKLAIVAPRESAKTTFLQRFIIWLVVRRKARYIIIIAESFERACDFLRDIKYELENNELLIYDYGKQIGKEWTKQRILTRNDIMISAFSKTSVRGAKFRDYRPDHIIIDDLENEAIVYSSGLNTLKQWFNKTVLHLGDYSSRYIMSGTIIGRRAILNEVSQDPTWKVLFYKAVMKYADRQDLWNEWIKIVTNTKDPDRLIKGKEFYLQHEQEMLKGVEVFWEENPLYNYYDLMVQRYVSPGIAAFESEKQNNPISFSESYVTEDQLQFYEGLPDDLTYFMGVDPSIGINDLTAMVIIGVDKHSIPFVIDAFTYKLEDPEEIAKIIIDLDRRYSFAAIGVESVGFQRWLNTIIRKLDARTGSKIIEIQVSVASSIRSQKTFRFRVLKPYILNAKFNPTLKMLIDQIITFPNCEHDDLIDALYIASRVGERYVPFIVV